jgi:PAS domain S-box-containing protein
MVMDNHLVSVLDALPLIVWTARPDGRVEFANQKWCDYTGVNLETVIESGLGNAIDVADLHHFLERWRTILASGQVGDVKTRVRRFDGQYRWFLMKCSPMRDDAQRIVRWCVVATEVMEFRRADSDFQAFVDGISAGVVILAPTGELEAVNKQILEYLGRTQDDLIEWGISNSVHPEDLQRVGDAITQSIAAGEPYGTEQRLRGADGNYRWFQVSGLPLRDAEGRIVSWAVLHINIDKRKRTEETLDGGERYPRQIVESIPGLVAVLSADGEVELVNHHILEYFGRTLEELKNGMANLTAHPEDLPHAVEAFREAVASGDPFEVEFRARRYDGVYRWLQSRGLPVRDLSGHIIRWYNLLIDIDERKLAEEALQRSQAQLAAAEHDLRLTIDTIPVFVATYRPDGTRSFVNQTWQDYIGITQEEATGPDATIFPHFHPDDVERNERAWSASLASGEPLSIEVRVRRADGQYRWHISRRVPLRDEKGDVVQWYSVGIDIEDQKRAEEELRRSEAFLAEGQHLALMGNFSWDVATGKLMWSDQLCRIFDFEPGAIVTLEMIADRVHPDDMPVVADMVRRAKLGEEDFEYQHRILLPDRSVRYLHLIAHRNRDHSGWIEYIGAVLDITQRRLSEEALEKVRSELAHVTRFMSLGVLAGSIAHEVSQPLSGIITNAGTCLRMLAADPPNIAGAQETARRTIRDGNRAADVITRLRALFSKRAAAVEPVDLNEAAQEVLTLLWSDFQRSKVVLRTDLTDNLPLVGGDRVQLQQVIMNLLRNAADAMSGVDDRPREILVRTELGPDDDVRLSVQDTGVGFGQEGTERLFEAFYTTKNEGMGIGLSVSRSIIESHNGRLWAAPNSGAGATFSFSISRYSGDGSVAKEDSASRGFTNVQAGIS